MLVFELLHGGLVQTDKFICQSVGLGFTFHSQAGNRRMFCLGRYNFFGPASGVASASGEE